MAANVENKAKEAFVDDQFELAVELYSRAIHMDPNNADLYADRALANIKLANFADAVVDANSAIQLDPSMAKAYLRKGTALLKLEEFQTAKAAFEIGASLAPGDPRFSRLMKECVQGVGEETDELPKHPVAAPVKPKPKYRHDYYQMPGEVVVAIFAKKLPAEHVVVDFAEQVLSIAIELPGEDVHYFQVALFGKIKPESCKYQILPTKIEIRLAKADPIHWASLTSLDLAKELLVSQASTEAVVEEGRFTYPSSKSNFKNRDEIEAQVKNEEVVNLGGDAALNKSFREIHVGANEDEERAMDTSFVKPKGTVFRGEEPQRLNRVNERSIQQSYASLYSVEMLMRELVFVKAKRYSYDELAIFTSNFENKIGSGSFGNVYKGQFSSGIEVAIKVLKMHDFVHHSFLTEIRTLGKTDHPNLIKLIGFCVEEDMLALVYEYMVNGSLDMILYKKPLVIEWVKLYAIAIEIANALVYLHHDCEDQIIHHDIKTSNVLLDSNHLPKLADFGLANLKDMERTHLTLTKCRGTPGYAAPEIWTPFSPITYKCDVYSFGMILFEILGLERNNRTDIWFPSHVWEKFNGGTLDNLMMECGISEKDREKATLLSLVALWCVQFTPQTRPSMKMVVTVLKNEMLVKKPPNPFLPSDSSDSMQSV